MKCWVQCLTFYTISIIIRYYIMMIIIVILVICVFYVNWSFFNLKSVWHYSWYFSIHNQYNTNSKEMYCMGKWSWISKNLNNKTKTLHISAKQTVISDITPMVSLFIYIFQGSEYSSGPIWHPYSANCRSKDSAWAQCRYKTQRTLSLGPWGSQMMAAGTWMLQIHRK